MARAMQAWFARCRREGAIPSQPSNTASGVEEIDGHRYAVLRNVNGTMAVYRVRNDGVLKWLRRWPESLERW